MSKVIIVGKNTVKDALNSDAEMGRVWIEAGLDKDERIQDIMAIAKKRHLLVDTISGKEFRRIAKDEYAQGVAAEMQLPEISLDKLLDENRNAFIVLLSKLDYEQNLGAIMRSAWAAGVDAIVASPDGVHEVTSTVAKVSMGAAAHVPVVAMSLYQVGKMLKKYAVKLVGVETNEGMDYEKSKLTGAVALLLGGEDVGLTENLLAMCDEKINIPMKGNLASLNVSVAAGIVMFERLRQERQTKV